MFRAWLHPSMAAIALLLASTMATAQENVLHGRVSYDAGNTLIKGTEDSEYAYATTNTIVLQGDTLWVDQGGQSEIEFSSGNFLRMADGSKADIVALPPSGTVRGWTGSFYVQRLARSAGDFVFQTPAAIIQIASDSAVRVDIVDEGATTVTVRWGQANIRTDLGGNTVASTGQRVWVDPGYLPSEAVAFDRTREDAFDQWNRERAEFLAGAGSPSQGVATAPVTQAAPVSYSDSTLGYHDLNHYGEWVNVDNRQYWRPTVVVDYVPFRYGYWHHTPRLGHYWVDHYPFSYVTSHYGRWRYMNSYGWCWSYDPVWSPAWVASIRVGDYFCWSPIDYSYRPSLGVGFSYFNVGGVNFGFYASSFAPYDRIYYGPRYINPCNDFFYDYYRSNRNNVYIWDIDINIYNNRDRDRYRVPFDRSLPLLRDYSPRRSIRGLEAFGDSGIAARQRAQTLEQRVARAGFEAGRRSGERGVRTVLANEGRDSRIRNVNLSRERPSYLRADRERPESAERVMRSVRERNTDLPTFTEREADRANVRVPRSEVAPEGRTRGGAGRIEPETPLGDGQATPEIVERSEGRSVRGGESRGEGRGEDATPSEGRGVRGEQRSEPGEDAGRATRGRGEDATPRGEAPGRGVRGGETTTPRGGDIPRETRGGEGRTTETPPAAGRGERGTPRSTEGVTPRGGQRTPARGDSGIVDRGRSTAGTEERGRIPRGAGESVDRGRTTTPDRGTVRTEGNRTPSRPVEVDRGRGQTRSNGQTPGLPSRGESGTRSTTRSVETDRGGRGDIRTGPVNVERRTEPQRPPEPRVERNPRVESTPQPDRGRSVQRSAPVYNQPQQQRGPAVRSETPRGSSDRGPMIQRIPSQSPRQVESRPAPRVQSPRQVESRPAPRMEAPRRVESRPAPRMEAPRVQRQAPQMQQRSAPSMRQPQRSAPSGRSGGSFDGGRGSSGRGSSERGRGR